MYRIIRTKAFERSYARLKNSGIRAHVIRGLENVIDTLAAGKQLAVKHKDHKLSGDLAAYRECHVRPNLLLIYSIDGDNLLLILVDVGSHSYLFD